MNWRSAEELDASLMTPDRPRSADQTDLVRHMLLQTDFEASITYGLFHAAACWRAVRRGVLRLP